MQEGDVDIIKLTCILSEKFEISRPTAHLLSIPAVVHTYGYS